MLMHFASAQPAIGAPPSLHVPPSPIEPEEVTPPSGGRRSPSFSHPFTKLDNRMEKEPPLLSRTASEVDGINVLLELSSAKRATSASIKSAGKRRRPAGQAETPAAKRSLKVAPEIIPSKCKPLSGARTEQLKVLAVAFSLCHAPSDAQVDAIAKRADLNAEQVTEWFQARRALQGWLREEMQRQPTVEAAEMVNVAWCRQASALQKVPCQ